MASRETARCIDLRAMRDGDMPLPVLIGLGGGEIAGATVPTIIEIGRGIEVGRGPTNRALRRLEASDALIAYRHVEVTTEPNGTVLARDLGGGNCTWIDGVRLAGHRVLRDGAVIVAGASVFVHRRVTAGDRDAIEEDAVSPFGPYSTVSPANARLVRQLRRLARSDLHLLLAGEIGVGKKVYAQAIHRISGRPGPFIAVNCASLPQCSVEGRLFGSRRATHSMAKRHEPGLLERANGGTLFIGDIGDMPRSAQSKLRRFLEDGTFLPVGSSQARRADVRVIAATRRQMTYGVHGLPMDLAACLGPHTLVIPPLRDRLEDLAPLVRGFLRGRATRIDAAAWHSLFLHRWPGNIRELQNTLRFALLMAGAASDIHLDDLPPGLISLVPRRKVGVTRSISDGPSRLPPQTLSNRWRQQDGNGDSIALGTNWQHARFWRWLRQEGAKSRLVRTAEIAKPQVNCK